MLQPHKRHEDELNGVFMDADQQPEMEESTVSVMCDRRRVS